MSVDSFKCFGGAELRDYPNVTFSQPSRNIFVNSNNVIYFEPDSTPSADLKMLYRLPMANICGGICTTSHELSITMAGEMRGLLFGLSDQHKTVLIQADAEAGNYQLVYATDHYDHITPNYLGFQRSSINSLVDATLRLENIAFGICNNSFTMTNQQQKTVTFDNDGLFGLDLTEDIDMIFVQTAATDEYGISALCIEYKQLLSPSVVEAEELVCGFDLPTSQPTSFPSSPSSMPTSQPTIPTGLPHDTVLLLPYVVSMCVVSVLAYALFAVWHYCIADRETSRDAHVLDAEEHSKTFFTRVILNRKDYYRRTSWFTKWWNVLLDRHKVFSAFSYRGERGRSNIMLKFTLLLQELVSVVAATMILYYIFFPDDGVCESHFAEETACKDTMSVLGLPLCYWKPVSSQCHYMPPLSSAYWSVYQTTSDKWVGDRDYNRIANQQEVNEHRRFSAYFYEILQNFHSVTYILVLSWIVLLLARAMTMAFERLFREKVYNSYLSWHKYAQFLNKKFGGEEEPTFAAKSISCLHACFVKPCWERFLYYCIDCKWLLAPSEKFDHKGRPRERKHHTHVHLQEIADPSVPVPSTDNGEYQEYLNHDLGHSRDPTKGVSVGGVGWSRQLTQYQDLVQFQKTQKELQSKQKAVINQIDQLRSPHVTLQVPPPRHEGPGFDAGRSAKTTLNQKGETSLHDHNNQSEDTILEKSEFNSRMQEERGGKKTPYVLSPNKSGSVPGSPATKRNLFLSPSAAPTTPPRLDAKYHGGNKYNQHMILERSIPPTPVEKDYPFREGVIAGAKTIANAAADEMNEIFGTMQEQYREFRESRPNSTQVYRNRYWNNGLSSSRPGLFGHNPASPDVEKGAVAVRDDQEEGPSSVPVQVFRSIQGSIMSAVKASANANEDFYSLSQEYEDLMIQASELVRRPRMSEEAATTVAYAKQMLGVGDDGNALNTATATNHRANSLWCCCCVLAQCVGGYVGIGYGGLYYPSTTTDATSTHTHSAITAPSKGSIMRNLQFSRIDSKRIFHRIYGLNNPMKNMFLLENFLLSEYPVTRYAAGNGVYLLGLDTIPPNVVSLIEYVFWVVFTVGLLFLLPLYFVWYYITVLTYKTNINDIIIIAGTAYVMQNAIISPLFLYWFRVVVAAALDAELSHVHVNIRNRARTVFERKYGFFGRDLYHNNSSVKSPTRNHALTRTSKSARVNLHNICCITDHYNPTCRVAKAYTGLIMFRLVLELNDYDINRNMHYILKRKHESDGFIKGVGMAARDGTGSGGSGRGSRGKNAHALAAAGGSKSRSGKTANSYLYMMKNVVGSVKGQLLGGDGGSEKSSGERIRRSVRKSAIRSAKIGVIPEGDEEEASLQDQQTGVDMALWSLENQDPVQELSPELGEMALGLGDGDDIELGLGGEEREREEYVPEEGEEGYEGEAAGGSVVSCSNSLAISASQSQNMRQSQKRMVLDSHLLYKDDGDLPVDPNENFDHRSYKAVPSARNLRLQMGENSVVASFLDGSSVGVTSRTSEKPVHLAPWEAAYEASVGAFAVAMEVCSEGCSRCYGCIPTCCISLLGAFLAGLLFVVGLCARGCKILGTCIADTIDACWMEILLRFLTTKSEKPCSRSGAYRCFQRCLNCTLTPIIECCFYKSTYTYSLVFGEGNIEWEFYYDRLQHAFALVVARIALTTFPVIGMGDVVFESLFTLLLFGFMALCWYVLLSDRQPLDSESEENEHWIAVNFKMVMRPVLLYALPAIAILMVIRAEYRRRSFNKANKNLADPVSPYDNVYPRIVAYLSKLEDLQGNGAEALLSKRLLLEHADTDDILNNNQNRRLDGRRGGIVDDINFTSGANLSSQNFHGATMQGKDDLINKAFSPSEDDGAASGAGGEQPEEGSEEEGDADGPATATAAMDRSMRTDNSLLSPKGYSALDKDYLTRKQGFFSSMKFLSQTSDSDSDGGAPASPSDGEEEKGAGKTEDITKTHTLANSFLSSGTYGQSRRDLVDRIEAEANSPSKGKKDPSGYFYVPRDPKKKKKKLDQQEEDIQQYMSQLSLVSKHTVKSYLKSSNEAANAAAVAAAAKQVAGSEDPVVSGDDGGEYESGSASGGSPKKKRKKKTKRVKSVTYQDY